MESKKSILEDQYSQNWFANLPLLCNCKYHVQTRDTNNKFDIQHLHLYCGQAFLYFVASFCDGKGCNFSKYIRPKSYSNWLGVRIPNALLSSIPIFSAASPLQCTKLYFEENLSSHNLANTGVHSQNLCKITAMNFYFL